MKNNYITLALLACTIHSTLVLTIPFTDSSIEKDLLRGEAGCETLASQGRLLGITNRANKMLVAAYCHDYFIDNRHPNAAAAVKDDLSYRQEILERYPQPTERAFKAVRSAITELSQHEKAAYAGGAKSKAHFRLFNA